MVTFTAVVPNYNDSAALPKALDSILAQTSPYDEIIVVDDASTDDGKSCAIIESYVAHHPTRIKFIRNPTNLGVIGAINVGMEAATSEFLIMCSSNDWYNPREVEICRAMIEKYPDITMICGNSATWDEARGQPGAPLILTFPQVEKRYGPAEYVAQNKRATAYFNGGAVALKRSQVLAYNKLIPALKWHSDLMLYLMFAYSDDFVFTPELLSTCRLEEAKSLSHGRFNWDEQKQVTSAMLRLFKTTYPKQGKMARASAMLPKYNFSNFGLLLQPEFMWYITPLLLWRIFIHSLFYWMRAHIPRAFITAVRPYFRV
jgi:glycosyltransferase involved in cell wall biosynthesis